MLHHIRIFVLFRSMVQRGDDRGGTKVRKERITFMPLVNAAGDVEWPLLVIGKSEKPRAFKNINTSDLGISYHSNR